MTGSGSRRTDGYTCAAHKRFWVWAYLMLRVEMYGILVNPIVIGTAIMTDSSWLVETALVAEVALFFLALVPLLVASVQARPATSRGIS